MYVNERAITLQNGSYVAMIGYHSPGSTFVSTVLLKIYNSTLHDLLEIYDHSLCDAGMRAFFILFLSVCECFYLQLKFTF